MDQTDRLEQEVIRGLTELYRDAERDVDALAAEFQRQHAEADARMRAELEAGNITREKYIRWRQVQMSRGARWETMKAQMADRMNKADIQAAAYINNRMPAIYALNHDYTCFQIDQAGVMEGGSFTLVNEETIRELVLGGDHVTFRTVNPNPVRNYTWNAQRVQRVLTVGILSGKSTEKIATDFQRLTGSNRKAAVRNARTAVTSAQSAGCQAAYDQAVQLGVEVQKEWMCTHDNNTRDSHAEMDGVRVGVNERFPNGLQYPGDPSGEPKEVYNCRCTMVSVLPYQNAWERQTGEHRKLYKDWLEEQERKANTVYAEAIG